MISEKKLVKPYTAIPSLGKVCTTSCFLEKSQKTLYFWLFGQTNCLHFLKSLQFLNSKKVLEKICWVSVVLSILKYPSPLPSCLPPTPQKNKLLLSLIQDNWHVYMKHGKISNNKTLPSQIHLLQMDLLQVVLIFHLPQNEAKYSFMKE